MAGLYYTLLIYKTSFLRVGQTQRSPSMRARSIFAHPPRSHVKHNNKEVAESLRREEEVRPLGRPVLIHDSVGGSKRHSWGAISGPLYIRLPDMLSP